MKNIREIISNNIILLRKKHQLTQVELAKKINYSDKAISRWEKGEVVPDVETLNKLSEIFNVPLTFMFKEHNDDAVPKTKPTQNDLAIQALTTCVIWVILTVIFVYVKIIYNHSFWQLFVWGIPTTALVSLRFCSKFNLDKAKFYCRTIINWTFIASVYLQFIHLNLWLIFLIGVPVQAAIFVSYFAKTKSENL